MPMEASQDVGSKSHPLDPDINPWERQPNESKERYDKFVAYRDSERRKIADHLNQGDDAARVWSWGYRAYQWDLYMARVDEEQMIRYRRQMNDRHRAAARGAQYKIVQWLNDLDPLTLTPTQAARWYELAIRVEREAAGANMADRQPSVADGAGVPQSDPSAERPTGKTLAEMLDEDSDVATEVARALHRLETSP